MYDPRNGRDVVLNVPDLPSQNGRDVVPNVPDLPAEGNAGFFARKIRDVGDNVPPIVFALAFLLAFLLSSAPSAHAQPIIRTTPYTRGLLVLPTAAQCRAYLGISGTNGGGGLTYGFDTNIFRVVGTNVTLKTPLVLTNVLLVGGIQGLIWDTNIFYINGTNFTFNAFVTLTNIALAGDTKSPVINLGSISGTTNIDASLSTEWAWTLSGNLTIGVTNWHDNHPVNARISNTGNFAVTYTNVMYWIPNGNATQITNDWGVGIADVYHFFKDGGVIYASDKEGIGTSTGGGFTGGGTSGQVAVWTSGTSLTGVTLTNVVETIADLVIQTPGVIPLTLVKGYYSANDGGGGIFFATNTITGTNTGTRFRIGATSQSWQRQAGSALNARWFGARGDGVTDDTAALQAVMDQATLGTDNTNTIGLQVNIPAGRYLISGPIHLRPGMKIEGEGIWRTQIYQTNTTSDSFEFTGTTNGGFIPSPIEIKDMHFLGRANATAGAGLSINGTTFETSAKISNVKITGHFNGLKVNNTITSTFSDIQSSFAASTGFRLGPSITSSTFSGCYALAPTGGNGWYMTNISYCSFISCASDQNAICGYCVEACANLTFSACGTESNNQDGWLVINCNNIALINPLVTAKLNVSRSAFRFDGGSGLTIENMYTAAVGTQSGETVDLLNTATGIFPLAVHVSGRQFPNWGTGIFSNHKELITSLNANSSPSINIGSDVWNSTNLTIAAPYRRRSTVNGSAGAAVEEEGLTYAYLDTGIARSGIYFQNDFNNFQSSWMVFKTANAAGVTTEALRIDKNGSLGIGTPTNLLSRSANNLVYSSGGGNPAILVTNGSATVAFGLTPSGNGQVQAAAGKIAALSVAGADDVYWTGAAFLPTGTDDLGSSGAPWRDLFLSRNIVWNGVTNTVFDLAGAGSPEGVKVASPGSLYRDYLNGVIYVKVTGIGYTGWTAVGSGGGLATPVSIANGGTGTNFFSGFADGEVIFYSKTKNSFDADESLFTYDKAGHHLFLTSSNSTGAAHLSIFEGSGSPPVMEFWTNRIEMQNSDFSIDAVAGSNIFLKIGGTKTLTADKDKSVIIGDGTTTTTRTNKFLYIPTTAGPPTGVPNPVTGTVALDYDTTGKHLNIYSAGWNQIDISGSTNWIDSTGTNGLLRGTAFVNSITSTNGFTTGNALFSSSGATMVNNGGLVTVQNSSASAGSSMKLKGGTGAETFLTFSSGGVDRGSFNTNGAFQTLSGRIFGRFTTATNYTINVTNHYVMASATCTNFLPAASSVLAGTVLIIKNKAGTTTVRPAGADTIDGTAADDSLTAKLSHTYISDGVSNWELN